MSNEMSLSSDKLKTVGKLVAECERIEPPFTSLGTPSVGLNRASQQVIDLGAEVVPYLCELLPTATSHGAACITFCLGCLSDSRAVPVLKATLRFFENKKNKDPFDYAVIGNAREALRKIEGQ